MIVVMAEIAEEDPELRERVTAGTAAAETVAETVAETAAGTAAGTHDLSAPARRRGHPVVGASDRLSRGRCPLGSRWSCLPVYPPRIRGRLDRDLDDPESVLETA